MAKLGAKTTAEEALQGADLNGKCAVVTGGNSGLGFETVRVLASAGADVIICCRNTADGEKGAAEIHAANAKAKVAVKALDLSDFASIKAFAASANAELPRIDLLICNAGVMACPLMRTKQGFEQQIGVNHIGHFYLTQLLLPKLKASGTADSPARVVAVSSSAHKMGSIDIDDLNYENRKYSSWGSYGQSKLANILFAKELTKRMKAENAPVVGYALHPGVIQTNLQRHLSFTGFLLKLFRPFINKTIPQGAATSVYAATAKDIPAGSFLADCQVEMPNKAAQDEAMATALWNKTEELVTKAAATV